MTTPNILTAEELAECERRLGAAGGTYAEVFEYAALLGARGALDAFVHKWQTEVICGSFIEYVRNFRDTRYPLPVREVPRRVTESNGWSFEIRNGVLFTDYGAGGNSEWGESIMTLEGWVATWIRNGRYADAALLCDLAANPTTTEGK